MKNENGFVTPFALSVVLILMVYCSYQLQALKSEQLFMKQLEQYTTLETLLQRGTADIISVIMNETETSLQDSIVYIDGQVNYSASTENGTIYHVTMIITVKNHQLQRSATFTYDKIKNRVISWQEANASESYLSYWIYGSWKDNGRSTVKSTT
jgi:hypothetical protein